MGDDAATSLTAGSHKRRNARYGVVLAAICVATAGPIGFPSPWPHCSWRAEPVGYDDDRLGGDSALLGG